MIRSALSATPRLRAYSIQPTLTPALSLRGRGSEVKRRFLMEEKIIASWKYKKGALDARTAYLCYLAANLAAGNTH